MHAIVNFSYVFNYIYIVVILNLIYLLYFILVELIGMGYMANSILCYDSAVSNWFRCPRNLTPPCNQYHLCPRYHAVVMCRHA